MRSIFLLVLTVNLLFFAKEYFFAVGADKKAAKQMDHLNESMGSVRGLVLLSEHSGLAGEIRANTANNVTEGKLSGSEANEGGALCAMIGPYEQLLQAEYAVERLAALGADVHVVPIEIKGGELFWVYLAPEVSEREALNRLYELQRKNIESHIISKGDLTNGISFGRFSRYEDAETLSLKIKNNGYEAQIKIMPKTIQETWVVIENGFADKIDASVWEELVRKQKGLEKRQNYCLGVASP